MYKDTGSRTFELMNGFHIRTCWYVSHTIKVRTYVVCSLNVIVTIIIICSLEH